MKKQLTLLFSLLTLSVTAQKLPAKVSLTLTDKQVLKIDSAVNFVQGNLDSKAQTKWFLEAFAPFYVQARKQMIVDTTKAKKK